MIPSSTRTALVAAALTAFAACADGFSTEEATEHCQAERDLAATADPGCGVTDDAFQECVICHEECGDACATVNTACPYTFQCPQD